MLCIVFLYKNSGCSLMLLCYVIKALQLIYTNEELCIKIDSINTCIESIITVY